MPIDILRNALYENHPRKTFETVKTRPDMELYDINSKLNEEESLRDIIDCAICARFYPTTSSDHHTLPHFDNFHGPTHHQANSYDKPNTK